MTGRIAIVMLFLAPCLVGCGKGPAADSSGARTSDPLARYAPILYFHPEETWPPINPDLFLKHAELLERRGKVFERVPVPASLPSGACTEAVSPCRILDFKDCEPAFPPTCYEDGAPEARRWDRTAVYGRDLKLATPTPLPLGFGGPATRVLQFWLFYLYDDWRATGVIGGHFHAGWQVHEGDWEAITIALDAKNKPLYLALSTHCDGHVMPWGRIERQGDRPKVYVALGSHANRFSAGRSSLGLARCAAKQLSEWTGGLIQDRGARAISKAKELLTFTGEVTDISSDRGEKLIVGENTPLIPMDSSVTETWRSFGGVWGGLDLLYIPTKGKFGTGYGPETPMEKDLWKRPVETTLSWLRNQ
jgi:hypothetical protein